MLPRISSHKPITGMLSVCVLALCLASPSIAQPQSPPLITDLRSGQLGESSRLVVEITEIVPVSLLLLVDPYRLVIDLGGARLLDKAGAVASEGAGTLHANLFHGYRFGVIPNTQQARLVIDLTTTATLEQIYWLPAINNKQRLAIDLADRGATAFRVAAQALLANRHIRLLDGANTAPPAQPSRVLRAIAPPPIHPNGISPPPAPPQATPNPSRIAGVAPPPAHKPGLPPPPSPTSRRTTPPTELALAGLAVRPPPLTTPPRRSPPPTTQNRDKWVVVIDAGHGGTDSGAIGYTGTKEKDITLAAAKELARLMVATGKITPILSRSDDRFHHLHTRVNFARRHQADVFISLHADAAPSAKAHGVSVFTLSDEASDEEARILASQENKADLIGGPDLDTTDPDITPVLLRIFQREAMNQSSGLADALLQAYQGLPTSIQRGHRFAGFVVLKAPDIPSVLIEMGFLTNRNDEQHLKSNRYRQDLLARTTQAVVAFLNRNQPSLPSQVPNI